jgi:hypothetical protein
MLPDRRWFANDAVLLKVTMPPQFAPHKVKVEYVSFMCLQGRPTTMDRRPAHDEFSSAGKVSLLNQRYEDWA